MWGRAGLRLLVRGGGVPTPMLGKQSLSRWHPAYRTPGSEETFGLASGDLLLPEALVVSPDGFLL